MGKKFKFNDNNFLDTSGIMHNNDLLSDFLNNLHTQKVLWETDETPYYMTGSQSIELKELVSQQKNGIVLVWSPYTSSTFREWNFEIVFIPKKFVELKNGVGTELLFVAPNFATLATKYIYIADGKITGNDNNNKTGSANGVTYNNSYWVLRYVLGV